MEKNLLKISISFIYFFYLLSLSTSMGGMEMFGWGAFLLLIPYLYIERKSIELKQFMPKWFFIVIILLIFISLLSVLSSVYPSVLDVSKRYYAGRVRNYIFIFVNLLILNSFMDYKKIIRYMLYFLILVVVYSLIQRFTGFHPVRGIWHFNRTVQQLEMMGVQGFFNMYLTYINVFQFHFFILLGFILFYKNMSAKYKISLSILCALLGVTFVFSGSRAILLAVFVGFIIQAVISRKKIFLLLIGVMLLTPYILYKTNSYMKFKINMTLNDQLGDDYRTTFWKTNWAMFKDHPIKGVGYEINEPLTWTYYKKLGITDKKYYAGHAHNMFIQMLSGTGLLGFIPFVIMWIMIFYMILKVYKWSKLENDFYDISLSIGLLGAMSSFVVNGLTQWNFGDMEVNHNLMFFIALTVYLWMKYYRRCAIAKKHE